MTWSTRIGRYGQSQAGEAGEDAEHPGGLKVWPAEDNGCTQQSEYRPESQEGELHGALAEGSRRHLEQQFLAGWLLQNRFTYVLSRQSIFIDPG
jgi:hypothetical protein